MWLAKTSLCPLLLFSIFCVCVCYSIFKQFLLFFFMSNIIFSQFNMDRANAEEFYEVYKGVVTEYPVSINTTSLCRIPASHFCQLWLLMMRTAQSYPSAGICLLLDQSLLCAYRCGLLCAPQAAGSVQRPAWAAGNMFWWLSPTNNLQSLSYQF